MTADVHVRALRDDDHAACAQLLHDVVHARTEAFYDGVLRAAWSPAPMPPDVFARRVQGQVGWVAEDAKGLAGFATFAPPDTVEFGYVRADYMGTGVADLLYEHLLTFALAQDWPGLRTQASRLAERFLLRHGWRVVRHQEVVRGDVRVPNAEMALDLAPLRDERG